MRQASEEKLVTIIILRHVDPLVGDDTAAVARQRLANNNRGIMFSERSTKQQLNINR
jgi:hypothetical protein